jgi:hypothetical protein
MTVSKKASKLINKVADASEAYGFTKQQGESAESDRNIRNADSTITELCNYIENLEKKVKNFRNVPVTKRATVVLGDGLVVLAFDTSVKGEPSIIFNSKGNGKIGECPKCLPLSSEELCKITIKNLQSFEVLERFMRQVKGSLTKDNGFIFSA